MKRGGYSTYPGLHSPQILQSFVSRPKAKEDERQKIRPVVHTYMDMAQGSGKRLNKSIFRPDVGNNWNHGEMMVLMLELTSVLGLLMFSSIPHNSISQNTAQQVGSRHGPVTGTKPYLPTFTSRWHGLTEPRRAALRSTKDTE